QIDHALRARERAGFDLHSDSRAVFIREDAANIASDEAALADRRRTNEADFRFASHGYAPHPLSQSNPACWNDRSALVSTAWTPGRAGANPAARSIHSWVARPAKRSVPPSMFTETLGGASIFRRTRFSTIFGSSEMNGANESVAVGAKPVRATTS